MITLAARLTLIEKGLQVLSKAVEKLVPPCDSSKQCPMCGKVSVAEGHDINCPSLELPRIARLLKDNRIPGLGEPFCEMCKDVMCGSIITSIGRQTKELSQPCVRCDQPTRWHVTSITAFDEYREIPEDKRGDRSYTGGGLEISFKMATPEEG